MSDALNATQAIAGVVGGVITGVGTLAGTWLQHRKTRRTVEETVHDQVIEASTSDVQRCLELIHNYGYEVVRRNDRRQR